MTGRKPPHTDKHPFVGYLNPEATMFDKTPTAEEQSLSRQTAAQLQTMTMHERNKTQSLATWRRRSLGTHYFAVRGKHILESTRQKDGEFVGCLGNVHRNGHISAQIRTEISDEDRTTAETQVSDDEQVT
jgi:hypothetical protein